MKKRFILFWSIWWRLTAAATVIGGVIWSVATIMVTLSHYNTTLAIVVGFLLMITIISTFAALFATKD